MEKTKAIIGTLIAIILVLAAAVGYLLMNDQHRHSDRENILHQFNKTDVARLNEMVARHQEGKGDYLLLIPPILDGGYTIHEVHSNGRTITWTTDSSRDMYSDQSKVVYTCKNIQIRQNKERYVYTVDQCEGHGDTFLPIFTFRKDSIER